MCVCVCVFIYTHITLILYNIKHSFYICNIYCICTKYIIYIAYVIHIYTIIIIYTFFLHFGVHSIYTVLFLFHLIPYCRYFPTSLKFFEYAIPIGYIILHWMEVYILFNPILSSFKPASLYSEMNCCRFVLSASNTISGFTHACPNAFTHGNLELRCDARGSRPPAGRWRLWFQLPAKSSRPHLLGEGGVWHLDWMNARFSGQHSSWMKAETPGKSESTERGGRRMAERAEEMRKCSASSVPSGLSAFTSNFPRTSLPTFCS